MRLCWTFVAAPSMSSKNGPGGVGFMRPRRSPPGPPPVMTARAVYRWRSRACERVVCERLQIPQ